MMCRIQRRTLGERVFVSDGWFGSYITGVQPEVLSLLVSFFLTDAASESAAGGNSEAKVLGVIHWIVGAAKCY